MTTPTKKTTRTKTYSAILYEEFAPSNWKEILRNELVPATVSPLHNRDTDEDGKAKKPHYHIMLDFSSLKTLKQAQEIFDRIGAIRAEAVKCKQAFLRYLCHLDQPNKAQYDPDEVQCFSGASYEIKQERKPIDKVQAIREMTIFCRDNDISDYYVLYEYCADNNPDWFAVLCTSANMAIFNYLRSKSWHKKNVQPTQQAQNQPSQPLTVTVNVQPTA